MCCISSRCRTARPAYCWAARRGFVALALSGVYNYRKDTNAGNMQVPGMIYMAVVAFMGALAVSVAIHAPGVSTLLFAVGGVLFIISDNILCAYSFGSERRFGANIGIHATYYARAAAHRVEHILHVNTCGGSAQSWDNESLTRRLRSLRGRISLQTGTPRNLTEPVTNFWRRSDSIHTKQNPAGHILSHRSCFCLTPWASALSAACASCRRA